MTMLSSIPPVLPIRKAPALMPPTVAGPEKWEKQRREAATDTYDLVEHLISKISFTCVHVFVVSIMAQ